MEGEAVSKVDAAAKSIFIDCPPRDLVDRITRIDEESFFTSGQDFFSAASKI